jgi:excisionase family DNA binding protein
LFQWNTWHIWYIQGLQLCGVSKKNAMQEIVVIPSEKLESIVIDAVIYALKLQQKYAPAPAKDPDQGPIFLTKRQAAAKLGVSTSTVDNAARAGRLTRHYVGKAVRFRAEEVEALAAPAEN